MCVGKIKGIYMEDGADGQEEQEAQKTIVTPEEEEDDDNFMQLMDQIGAQNVFEELISHINLIKHQQQMTNKFLKNLKW